MHLKKYETLCAQHNEDITPGAPIGEKYDEGS